MESSSLAGILIEPLSKACPGKKFILTIRDLYSWCDSWIDHNIDEPPSSSSPWGALDRIRLRVDDVEPTRFDSPLTERGLPPLACYHMLATLDRSYVQDTADRICGRLMDRYFPEVSWSAGADS
jgi:hypothetical protein